MLTQLLTNQRLPVGTILELSEQQGGGGRSAGLSHPPVEAENPTVLGFDCQVLPINCGKATTRSRRGLFSVLSLGF